jgi:hypothetical protein
MGEITNGTTQDLFRLVQVKPGVQDMCLSDKTEIHTFGRNLRTDDDLHLCAFRILYGSLGLNR